MIKEFKEFKEFIARGNVIDLAVAVVLGAAFTQVVDAFSNNILMQLIAAIGGQPDFSELSFTINGAEIGYGIFLTATINFVIVGFAMFLVVKAINKMQNLKKADAEEASAKEPSEVELLTEIRDALKNQNR